MRSEIVAATVLLWVLCNTSGTSVAETGSRPVAVSVLAQPTDESPVLTLQFHLAPDSEPPNRLSILGKNQSLIPSALSHNAVLGLISVETAAHGELRFLMHSLVRSGTNRWNFQVSSEDGIGPLPVAQGELNNTSNGFLLDLAAAQWLADLSRKFALPAVVDTEFEFAVPVVPGSGGDVSYSVSISGSTGPAVGEQPVELGH